MPNQLRVFDPLRHLFTLLVAMVVLLAILLTPHVAFAAAGVRGDVAASIKGAYSGSNALGTPSFTLNVNALMRLTEGTTANKADKVYANTLTITASSSTNLDLAGVLADPFGVTLTFVKIRAIYFHAATTNTNNVCFGGAASNGFLGPFADATDIACVQPGGFLMLTAPNAGWTVTPATGDILKAANSGAGTSVTGELVIVGTSA